MLTSCRDPILSARGGISLSPGDRISCRTKTHARTWMSKWTNGDLMSKRIDLKSLPVVTGSGYPPPFDAPCAARARQRLGDAAALTDFGVNLLRLSPGVWSSQRHWHTAEDEFVYVVAGEVVLVTDAGEEVLRAGDCAGFK